MNGICGNKFKWDVKSNVGYGKIKVPKLPTVQNLCSLWGCAEVEDPCYCEVDAKIMGSESSWFGGDSVGETREAAVFEGYRVKDGLSWSCGLDESASLIGMGSSGGLGSACCGNYAGREEEGI